jgi:deoxyribonuclease I
MRGHIMRTTIIALGCLATLISLPTTAIAQQQISDGQVASRLLWSRVYPEGGTSLFCGQRFNGEDSLFTVSPIYSSRQLKSALRCITDRQCSIMTPDFPYMAADLHNLYPVLKRVDEARGTAQFGEMDANTPSAFADIGCQMKTSFRIVEPRDEAKGNIARAIFHMHKTYGLPIPSPLEMYQKWHQMDPPDAEEKTRNDRIEALQGTRNDYIDNPALAEQLQGN